jgi:mono/diheme cytochrome c family protein
VTADDTYLFNSIQNPNLQIVKGFPANRMPNFSDTLDAKAIADIVAYIKSLK